MTEPQAGSRATLAVLALGGLLFAVSQSMVVPLLPSIARDLDADFSLLTWTVTGQLVVAAAVAPLLGRLADLHGRKPVLIAIMAAMLAGGVLIAAADLPAVVIAGRCMQGLGGAFVPIAISLLRDLVSPRMFTRGIALLSSCLGAGVALGVPIAALVAHILDWRFAFLAVAAVAAVALVLTLTVITEPGRDRGGHFDIAGAAMLLVLLTVLMLTITISGTEHMTWQIGVGAIAFLLAAGAGWVLWEKRSPSPLVDLRAVGRLSVVLTNTAALFVGFALISNIVVTTQLFQSPRGPGGGFGLGLIEAGLYVAPAGVSMILAAQLSASLTQRFGGRTTLLIGAGTLSVGYVLHLSLPGLVGAEIALIVVAAGVSISYAALPVLVSDEVPSGQMASANSINVLLRTVGQATSSAVVGAAALAFGGAGSQDPPGRSAIDVSYAAAGVASLLALIAAANLPKRGAR